MEVTFEGPAGILQGYLLLPDRDGTLPGVVVCHPHPLMGGDLHNNVVVGICHKLAHLGIASLSFNFRGVGRSQGIHDDGHGEVDDTLAAVKYLVSQDRIQCDNVGVAGYSFGAGIAIRATLLSNLTKAVCLIARATIDPDYNFARRPDLPVLFVLGSVDKPMNTEQFMNLKTKLVTPPEVQIISGADHFFMGHEREVGEMVGSFFRHWLSNRAIA